MAITTSQQSAFEDAVLDLIRAEPTLAGVQVVVGPLGDDMDAEYIASLGGPEVQDWAFIGQGRKREDLQVTLECYASSTGGGEASVKAARDRIDVFIAAIETALRAGVNLPAVGPVRRVQIDSVDAPVRGAATHNVDDRAEYRTVTVTGLADLYNT